MVWISRDARKNEDLLVIENKRFPEQRISLLDLIDDTYLTRQFFKDLTLLGAINKVLVEIDYPIFGKRISDFHYYQAFKTSWFGCYKSFANAEDYWQFAWETAWLKMGDCEDTSILLASYLEMHKYNYYICFGEVYHQNTLLGGHAWIVVEISPPEGNWRLVETTLDEPIPNLNVLPQVDILFNDWYVDEIRYHAYIMINKRVIREYEPTGLINLKCYMKVRKKYKKNERKKIQRIREVWSRWIEKKYNSLYY